MTGQIYWFPSADGFNGYYHYNVGQCRFSSYDQSDLEYIMSYVFNKDQYIVFNSTVDKYVGYTDIGVHNAELWNKDPAMMAQMRAQKETYCKRNTQNEIKVVLTKTGESAYKQKLSIQKGVNLSI